MSISDYLDKQRKYHESVKNLYVNPRPPPPQQSAFFNDQFEKAQPPTAEITHDPADIIIMDRKPKKKPFDIGEYGETRGDMIENIIRLKPTHNECRKVLKSYCNLIMDEDLFL